MTLRPKASFLVLALTSGLALGAPPPTPTSPPPYLTNLKKIIMDSPWLVACPVVSVGAFLSSPYPWVGQDFLKSGVTAQSAYTKPGVAHDSMWCVYKVSSDHVPGSETDFLLEKEAVPGKPVCQADNTKKSFTCYPLKSGEFY